MSTSSRNQSKELKDLTIDDFPEMRNVQEPKINVEQKMELLQKNLNNPQLSQYHENLKAALDLYKAGKCPTSQNPWVLQNGRLLGRWPTPEDVKNGPIFIEQEWHQYGRTDPSAQIQQGRSAQFPLAQSMHLIPVRMRAEGTDPMSPSKIMTATICNDTGSNVLSIFPSDLPRLGIDATRMLVTNVQTAGGQVQGANVFVQIQLLTPDATNATGYRPISDWILETGFVQFTGHENAARLSGAGMRNVLYFATPPGNQTLAVAEKKHGLMSLLPTL